MDLQLKRVDAKNIWALTALKVREDQTSFVASNTVSLLEAYATVTAGKQALPFGVYDGETPVGFLMLGYDALGWEDEPEIAAARLLYRSMGFVETGGMDGEEIVAALPLK